MRENGGDLSHTLGQVDKEWQRFVDVARRFPPEEQVRPGVVGEWTVKDILGHVATWDQETVANMERSRTTDEEPTYGAIDQWNRAAVERKRGLTVEQTWQDLEESHQRLIDHLKGLPEELLGTSRYSRRHILGETAVHYREHRMDLERWQPGDA